MLDSKTRRQCLKLIGPQAEPSEERRLSIDSEVIHFNYNRCLSDIGSLGYNGIYSSLKARFILDSLTCLSLYFSAKKSSLKKSEIFLSSGIQANTEALLISGKQHECWLVIQAVTLMDIFKEGELEHFYSASKPYAEDSDFKVVEYFPSTFEAIRSSEGVELKDLIEYSPHRALHPVDNLAKLSSLCGDKGGRSGSFVYRTFDKRFIVKTIKPAEKRVFLSVLLAGYSERILSKTSVLVRVYGVFMLQSIGNYSVNLMVMDNIAASAVSPCYKLDLKGCTLNRTFVGSLHSTLFLRDLDFLDKVKSLGLEPEDRRRFLECLEGDLEMLGRLGVMDYSVFGAYFSEGFSNTAYSFHKQDSSSFYTLGLIDFLQDYSTAKCCEHWTRRILQRAEPSSVAPELYADRLLRFCRQVA